MNTQNQRILQETLRIVSIGSGQRSSRPMIELTLEFQSRLEAQLGRLDLSRLHGRFEALHPALASFPEMLAEQLDQSDEASTSLARLVSHLSLGLQRAANHLVFDWGLVESGARHSRFWFEYEEQETAEEALGIALAVVEWLLEPAPLDSPPLLQQRIDSFLSRAPARAMPADTRAIVVAAGALGIPVMRMDRPPYDPIRGSFRLRQNGLLRLGHGRGQQTVDGCFAVNRSEPVFGLVQDRAALFDRLRSLSLPLPADGGDWLQSPAKAGRLAERLGYPVVVRSASRGQGFRHAQPANDREQVADRATLALDFSHKLMVQRQVQGRIYELLVAGSQLIGAFEARVEEGAHRWCTTDRLHDSVGQCAVDLARKLDVGLLVMSVVTPDPGCSLEDAGGAIVDVELDPRLGRLLAADDPMLMQAAEAFVEWLFPQPDLARIPLFAVTGTNGKTTTTRMLASMAEAAGYTVGESNSTGYRVGPERISDDEDSNIFAHLAVLDHPETELAVLESNLGAVATRGLGFARCDVAICLNVSADHLEDALGLTSVDQLAEIKQAIVERADRAVVLNADDRRCLAMAAELAGRRVGLVSIEQAGEELLRQAGPGGAAAVLELRDGIEWLVLHDQERVVPLIRADGFPLSFAGTARVNLLNAMHAALAAWMFGLEASLIAASLEKLPAGFDGVQGRLSFRDDLSFKLCMDYAHNPAGMRALCDFVDRQPVSGRRILCFSSSNANSDDAIRAIAEAAAGHFDIYICKNFGKLFGRQPEESPALLKEGLLRAGVSADCIHCVLDEFDAFDQAMGMGRPGDLVVLIGGKRRQALWDRVMSFEENS